MQEKLEKVESSPKVSSSPHVFTNSTSQIPNVRLHEKNLVNFLIGEKTSCSPHVFTKNELFMNTLNQQILLFFWLKQSD